MKNECKDRITEAVKHFKGVWPFDTSPSMLRCIQATPSFATGEYTWYPERVFYPDDLHWDFICTKDDFEKRATELGYVANPKQPEEPSPKPNQYRKLTVLVPWEVVKRWEEQNDLYSHQSTMPDGFGKISHIQQLAQLISEGKVYEKLSERELFAEKVKEVLSPLEITEEVVNKLFDVGLCFEGEVCCRVLRGNNNNKGKTK